MKNPKLFESLHTDFATGKALEYGSEITLLDLFAGMAMHSLIQMSSRKWFRDKAEKKAKKHGMRVENCLARDAYRWGQNMLEERENILKGENDA